MTGRWLAAARRRRTARRVAWMAGIELVAPMPPPAVLPDMNLRPVPVGPTVQRSNVRHHQPSAGAHLGETG